MEAQKPNKTEVEALASIVDASIRAPESLDPREIHAVVLKGTSERPEFVEIVDLEEKLDEPRRKHGTFLPADVASFVAYVKNHHDENDSTIWIHRDTATITAILNDHSPIHPGWGDHKALLTLERTPEWQHWKGGDGRWFDQESFAEHVQQGVFEIAIPDPATMLEVAQSLQGHTSVSWKTARRLDNGEVSFAYQETMDATAGRTAQVEVPSEFTLNVVAFYGEDMSTVDARLRYRVRDGVLSIGYQLVRPHEVELGVLKLIRDRLGETFPRVYMGKPRG